MAPKQTSSTAEIFCYEKIPERFLFDYSIFMIFANVIRAVDVLSLNSGNPRVAGPLLLTLVAGLAGCTATKSATTISAPRTIEASQAMIMPAPGGPSIISLIEARFSDGVEQKVILGTDATNEGQNYLSIRMYGPMERETRGKKKLGYRAFTSAALSGEVGRAMPGVPMKISGLFLRNTYGPIGYAFGHTKGGDSCIFGWQQLRSSDAERSSYRNVGAIQIRLRLCENGASEKELLSVMYGYTVTGSFSSDQWNPFGRAKNADSTIGVDGEPIYPNDSELSEPPKAVTVQPVMRHRSVVAKRHTEESVVEETVDEEKGKRIVDVPAPSDADTDSMSTENDAISDDANGKQVLVPGPGCMDGTANCN